LYFVQITTKKRRGKWKRRKKEGEGKKRKSKKGINWLRNIKVNE
jgi:hypothetical protein